MDAYGDHDMNKRTPMLYQHRMGDNTVHNTLNKMGPSLGNQQQCRNANLEPQRNHRMPEEARRHELRVEASEEH